MIRIKTIEKTNEQIIPTKPKKPNINASKMPIGQGY
jgi:hypothetical protein